MNDRERMWRAYELDLEMFRHYLDLLLKFNVFFYAVTGALLSFFVTRGGDLYQARWVLLLPLVMAVLFAFFFGLGIWVGVKNLGQDFESVRAEFELASTADHRILGGFLAITAALLVIVAAGLLFLFCNPGIVERARAAV